MIGDSHYSRSKPKLPSKVTLHINDSLSLFLRSAFIHATHATHATHPPTILSSELTLEELAIKRRTASAANHATPHPHRRTE